MMRETYEKSQELQPLCDAVRSLVERRAYDECEKLLCDAMGRYPHAPEPHNLMGVLQEKLGNHLLAMKHFRAAWALDPTYRPVRQNLDSFASFTSSQPIAFDESDCAAEMHTSIKLVYDEQGIGHFIKGK